MLFAADWSGTCHIAERLARKAVDRFEGKLTLLIVDVDKNPDLVTHYHVTELPTMLVFVAGAIVDRIDGLLPEAELFARVGQVLTPKKKCTDEEDKDDLN